MKSILVVDDSSDMRELIKTILEIEGYSVSVACSGREGLDAVGLSPNPDLILLDFQLGDMDATEFVGQLRLKNSKHGALPKIVLMTGEANPPIENFDGFIRKMSDIKIFLKKIDAFFDDSGTASNAR